VSAELIQPDIPILNTRAAGAGRLQSTPTSCNLRLEDRFTYFKSKVCKARIWEDDGGLLFKRLRDVACKFMADISRLCDDRFELLCMEPGGASLTAFFATPETSVPLVVGHILRQDHEEVSTFCHFHPLICIIQNANLLLICHVFVLFTK
jgi:hypothetical protein